jgi:hypothetical protein
MNDIVKRHRLNVDIVDQHDLCETLFKRKEFWTDYYLLTRQSGIGRSDPLTDHREHGLDAGHRG